MRPRLIILLFACGVALGFLRSVPYVQAQEQPESQPVPRPDTGPIRFDRLSIDDGLMQRSVDAIVQDRQGFMWFGTQDGIDKYDGYTFTPYKHDLDDPQSLRSGYVRVLYEDADGILWIGIRGGLNRFDPATETFTHYLHVPEDTTSLGYRFSTDPVLVRGFLRDKLI